MSREFHWAPTSVRISEMCKNVKRGRIVLNPPHQRGNVHDIQWKRDIIKSIFTIGVIPPTFWHERNRKTESLDGKQRMIAIYEFYMNKFKISENDFSINPEQTAENPKMYCFDELSEEQRYHFEEFRLTEVSTKETLTDKEISYLFSRLQIIKITSNGEFINSLLGYDLTDEIRKTAQDCMCFEKLKNNENVSKKDEQKMKRLSRKIRGCRLFIKLSKMPGKPLWTRMSQVECLLNAYICYYYPEKKTAARSEISIFIKKDDADYYREVCGRYEKMFDLFREIAKALDKTKERHIFQKTKFCPFVLFCREEHIKARYDVLKRKLEFIEEKLSVILENFKNPCNGGTNKVIDQRVKTLNTLFDNESRLHKSSAEKPA